MQFFKTIDSGDLEPVRRAGWLRVAWRCVAPLLLVLLSACGEPVTPPLTVGMNPWVGYDPLVLARDRGLADPRRLRVVELPSGSETLRHLRNGLIDAAALTLDEALRLADSGVEVRIVAMLDASNGGDAVMVAPHIKSLAEIKGEFIAVEDSAVGSLLLHRMLNKAGLSRADVKVVNMEATEQLGALEAGRVGAAVTYEPLAGAMQQAGYQRIFDSRQIPGEILDVLVVRKDVLLQRPADVDALLMAWYAGLDVFELDTPGAAQSLAQGTDLVPEDYQTVLGGLIFYSRDASARDLVGTPPALADKAQKVVETLTEVGLLKQPPQWEALVDGAPMRRLQARRQGS